MARLECDICEWFNSSPFVCERQRAALQSSSSPSTISAVQSSTSPSTLSNSYVTGGNTPCGNSSSNVWGASHRSTANTSPSSLSPTPSPAGSVGSESSQSSSGYTTDEARQKGLLTTMGATPPQITSTMTIPTDIHNNMVRHYMTTLFLSSAYDRWLDAEERMIYPDVKGKARAPSTRVTWTDLCCCALRVIVKSFFVGIQILFVQSKAIFVVVLEKATRMGDPISFAGFRWTMNWRYSFCDRR